MVRGTPARIAEVRRFASAEMLTYGEAIAVLMRGWARLSDEDQKAARQEVAHAQA